MSKIAVAACASYGEETVRSALNEVLRPFEIENRIRPGMKVVIKANLVSMMKPEAAATTHPALLKELCRVLISLGADVIVGDSPGGLYTKAFVNSVYNATGVNCVTEVGARLNDNFSHRHVQNPDGHTLKELDYTSYLDDADMIINFCKLKTHGMMSMSACVKNMFGCVPGVFKPEYHYRFASHPAFANMLIDLNERFKTELCIVDAVTGMEGNGPTAGTPRFIGALIASDSPYDCDRVCAEIIGIEPETVETIKAAKLRKLEGKPEITGDYRPFIQTDYKRARERDDIGFGIQNKLISLFISNALASRPQVVKAECIGCAKCDAICPAKAIVMTDKKPVIDRKKCIRCFCCQEFCPKGAMKVKRPLIAKIINR